MFHKQITVLYPFQGKTLGGGHISIISMIKILDTKNQTNNSYIEDGL